MVVPTFDGVNLLIILPSAEPVIDVRVDLYSEWKLWVLDATNARFPQAFTTEGGQDTAPGEVLGRAYFLRNDLGWRIRNAEEDADVRFDGNFFQADVTLPIFVPTLGTFTVTNRLKFSSLAFVEQSAALPTEAHMGSAYDDTGNILRMSIFGERLGATVLSPVSCQVNWYNPDGTLLFTVSDSSPDSQGIFQIIRTSTTLLKETAYYVVVTVTDSTGPIVTTWVTPTGP